MKNSIVTNKAEKTLTGLRNIAEDNSLSESIIKEIDDLKKSVSDYSVKVVLIGRFSAGKTAFINALIGRQLLTENTLAETSVPTELYYSPTEHVIKVTTSGERQTLPLDALSIISTEDCDHFELYLDVDFIREFDGWTLVDMPGLDSTVEAHHNSILKYANHDSLCLVMVSCEDGDIDINTLQFVKEMQEYQKNVALMITKSDLNPSGAEEVAAHARKTIEYYTGSSCPTAVCSASDDSTDEIREKLSALLSKIDCEKLIGEVFAHYYGPIVSRSVAALKAMREGLSLDKDALEAAVDKADERLREAEHRMEKEKRRAMNKFMNEQKDEILDSIRDTLFQNSEQIAQMIKNDQNGVPKYINKLIRPVLMREMSALVEDMDLINGEIETDFDVSYTVVSDTIDVNPAEKIENALTTVYDTGVQMQSLANKYCDPFADIRLSPVCSDPGSPTMDPAKRKQAADSASKILGTIAILSETISPYLEIAIVAIPQILNVMADLFGGNDPDKDLDVKVRNSFIPQYMNQIETSLEESLFPNLLNAIVSETVRREKLNIQATQDAAEKALEMKNSAESDYAERTAKIDEAINQIIALGGGNE